MNRHYRKTFDLHPQLAYGGDNILLLPVDRNRLGEESEEPDEGLGADKKSVIFELKNNKVAVHVIRGS